VERRGRLQQSTGAVRFTPFRGRPVWPRVPSWIWKSCLCFSSLFYNQHKLYCTNSSAQAMYDHLWVRRGLARPRSRQKTVAGLLPHLYSHPTAAGCHLARSRPSHMGSHRVDTLVPALVTQNVFEVHPWDCPSKGPLSQQPWAIFPPGFEPTA
jgi:hypothetical protein